MTLLVRDEEDVLGANLRHHLSQGVDHVIVYDHGSTDATPEILAEYVREGVATVTRQDDPGYHQEQWVTEMARAAATEHGADWVVNADADEFFMPAAGTLAELLDAVPPDLGKVVVPRNDLVLRPEDGRPFHERMTIREASSRSPLGFPLLPKVIHRGDPGVEVAMGNHDVTGGEFAPLPPLGLIDLVHAPMRSWEQFSRRIRNMGEAFEATPDVGPDVASDQRYLYTRLLDGTLREWFDERVFADSAVHAGLEQGLLVGDDRIARSLAGEPVGAHGPGAAKALVAERVDVMREWLIARLAAEREPLGRRIAELDGSIAQATERIEVLSGERATLKEDLDTSRDEAATLHRHLEAARAELRELQAELAELRSSRAVQMALRAGAVRKRFS